MSVSDFRALLALCAILTAVGIVELRGGQVIIQHIMRQIREQLLQLRQESSITITLTETRDAKPKLPCNE